MTNKNYINICCFLIVFVFLDDSFLSSQIPYELFNSKSIQFYGKYPFTSGSNFYLRGLKPDSVKISGTDSIYFQYKTTTSPYTTTTCVNSRDPSWTGIVTKRRTNGDYVFYNSFNDSILIKTQFSVGSNWVYYTNPLNGNYLVATVSQKTFSPTYDNYSDTVKIITFQNYNNLNQPIHHYYNSQKFVLSKTQGLIRCGAFFNFPSDTTIYNRSYGKILKRMDIYNYNVGDEIHTQTSCYNFTTLINTSWFSFLITSKVFVNPDSVFYTINRQSFSGTLSPVTSTTLSYGQLSQLLYKAMPSQTNLNGTKNIELSYRVDNYNTPCQRFVVSEANAYPPGVSGNDSCLIPNLVSPVSALPYFIENVGAFSSSPISTGLHCNTGVAFAKISGVVCGSPLTLALNTDTYSVSENLNIYPNPASSILNVANIGKGKIETAEVYDMIGRKVLVQNENTSQINIQNLEQGVYQLILTSEGKNYAIKLIKE